MRIRSTKPEFWKSRRIASVDWDARLVLTITDLGDRP